MVCDEVSHVLVAVQGRFLLLCEESERLLIVYFRLMDLLDKTWENIKFELSEDNRLISLYIRKINLEK